MKSQLFLLVPIFFLTSCGTNTATVRDPSLKSPDAHNINNSTSFKEDKMSDSEENSLPDFYPISESEKYNNGIIGAKDQALISKPKDTSFQQLKKAVEARGWKIVAKSSDGVYQVDLSGTTDASIDVSALTDSNFSIIGVPRPMQNNLPNVAPANGTELYGGTPIAKREILLIPKDGVSYLQLKAAVESKNWKIVANSGNNYQVDVSSSEASMDNILEVAKSIPEISVAIPNFIAQPN